MLDTDNDWQEMNLTSERGAAESQINTFRGSCLQVGTSRKQKQDAVSRLLDQNLTQRNFDKGNDD